MLPTIWAPVAISDFDAFVYDPHKFVADSKAGGQSTGNQSFREDENGTVRACLNKHSYEVAELLGVKGGVVIVLLRPSNHTFHARYYGAHGQVSDTFSLYFLLDRLQNNPLSAALNALAAGAGTSIVLDQTKAQPGYLTGLRGHLKFETSVPTSRINESMEVLAVDSVGKAVAFSVRAGKGTVLFLPIPENVDGERLGGILLETIRSKLSVSSIEKPSWVEQISVPGTQEFINRIEALKIEHEDVMRRLQVEQSNAQTLLKHRELLFGTGKLVLEPAVRQAFGVLGFNVLGEDAYAGEWDLDMTDPDGVRIIGEVEGPEGAVDIQKFRQLLNYMTDEAIEGRDSKGLLIGNAFRNAPPDERAEAFTEHALRGASKHGVGLIATTELFKAVCAVLEQPDEEFKRSIRASILDAVGPWQFVRSEPIAEVSVGNSTDADVDSLTGAQGL
jgi:hypothetical protein